jgi:hypothetical protein
VKRKSAVRNNSAYSAAVRSLPVVTTSIFQVDHFRHVFTVVVGHDSLDDQRLCATRHRGADIAQDCQRSGIVPVVHDVLEHIGIPAGWHRLNERAPDSGAPIGDARSVEDRGSSLNHGFGVEQYPVRLRSLKIAANFGIIKARKSNIGLPRNESTAGCNTPN